MKMRLIMCGIALLALSACGDLRGPLSGATDALRDRISGTDAAAPVVPVAITRAQITADPAATLRVTDRLGRVAILQAVAELDGIVTYRTVDGVSLAFRGPELLRTRGLTGDIAGQNSTPDLPLDQALGQILSQAALWGDRAQVATHLREQRRITPLADVQTTTLECILLNTGPDPQTIVEQTYPTMRIEESCAQINSDTTEPVAFINTWWVEPERGQVWRARQWVSPAQGYLDIEVLKPFG